MVGFARPKSPHAIRFRTASSSVLRIVDVSSYAVEDEFLKCAVREVEDIATTHPEQLFKLVPLGVRQIRHERENTRRTEFLASISGRPTFRAERLRPARYS